MKEYIAVKQNPAGVTDLKIEIVYNLGGMNYFTYQTEKRGYYITVSPVTRNGAWETYTAFSGGKYLLNEVKRRSKKAEAEAEAEAEKVKAEIVKHVLTRHGLDLESSI